MEGEKLLREHKSILLGLCGLRVGSASRALARLVIGDVFFKFDTTLNILGLIMCYWYLVKHILVCF